jgi:formylglycine-generating enzyme required for sulfatase activity
LAAIDSRRKTTEGKTMKKLLPLVVVLVLAVLPVFASDARFKGTGKADPIRVTNARLVAGSDAGPSAITFDLAWDWSWRTAWEEPAERTGDPAPRKLESWDAAWVFAKIKKPGKAVWQHATLTPDVSRHTVPSGASLELGLSDTPDGGVTSGTRGIGAFIFRSAPGQGPNVWNGITLTCADVPADAEVRVFALPMVYVPSGAFWAGDGSTTSNRIKAQFSAGASTQPLRITSEQGLTLGGMAEANLGNRDTLGMSPKPFDDFNSRFPQQLADRYPKGYAAFYCMRTEITQQQYVDFLNTLTYKQQAARMTDKPSSPAPKIAPVPGQVDAANRRIQIATSGIADANEPLVIQRGTFTASGVIPKPGKPAVYKTSTPDVACNRITFPDGAAYTAWAGLRPMTELEFEKACRGPLLPVPDEYAWGTAAIAGMAGKGGAYTLKNPGMPDEMAIWEGTGGPDATHGNAPFDGTNEKLHECPIRAGCFATPDSDRVRAGASYWGILDLTGNLNEGLVSVGSSAARTFAGNHGEGGDSPWTVPFGMRGGGIPGSSHSDGWDKNEGYRVSNRYAANVGGCEGDKNRHFAQGFRGVRTSQVKIEK